MNLSEVKIALIEDVRTWCRGQSWVWRAPILAYLAWIGWRSVLDPQSWNLFCGITLAFHEMGHVLFSYLGEWWMVAGGSITQLLVPMLAGAALLWQRDYFGVSVAGVWLSLSLQNLSAYVGDARMQALPLVGLSSDPLHDWHYLLDHAGLLPADTTLAFGVHCAGILVFGGSLAFAGWLLWLMGTDRKESSLPFSPSDLGQSGRL